MGIDILLATYNGGEYIENQILSLIGQTYKNWRLIVHDDGSSDNTLDLIKRYQTFESRIEIIEDSKKFGNPAENFLHLVRHSTQKYIIFCDQDDIWLEDKLQQLISNFKATQTPMAVFCNGYSYSKEKGIINQKITPFAPTRLQEQLFLNAGIQGCSLMFNIELKQKLFKIPLKIAMHDHFITLGAICFGQLKYVDRSLMLYRQYHSNKVTANIEVNTIKRLSSIFFSDIPVIDRRHRDATLAFYHTYLDELSLDQKRLFDKYFLYSESRSLLHRLKIIITNGFTLYGSILPLFLKTLTRKAIN